MVNWVKLIILGIITIIIGISTFLYANMHLVKNDHVTHKNYSMVNTITEHFTKWSDRLSIGDISPRRDVKSSLEFWKPIKIEEQETIIPNTSISSSPLLNNDNGYQTPILTYDNKRFQLDGVNISPFGVRVANALEDEIITQRLIDNLDLMKSYGIHSVNISLQGARTGSANAFHSNGTLKNEYVNRLANILDALEERNMVGVVTYFYQARDQELEDDDAVRVAVIDATMMLKPWRNVWLYTINEWYHFGFDQTILKTTAGQKEIFEIIKGIDPQRITFVSDSQGANDAFFADTGKTASNGNVVVEYRRQDGYDTPGIFTTNERLQAQQDAEATLDRGGYWYWHASWHQKADTVGWPQFSPGGDGTIGSPGVSFIWNTMKSLSHPSYLPFQRYLPIMVVRR